MCKVICITNRLLCGNDFLTQLRKIAAAKPDSIILREKDLSESDYISLSEKVLPICQEYAVPFTMHFYYRAALRLGVSRIHLPLFVLRKMTHEQKLSFSVIGVSCHSTAEAQEAQQLGASYITAGHIFPTDCKAGTAGRGTDFLHEVKKSVTISVYAIGGISAENASKTISAGADGVCMMSGFMKSGEPSALISALKEAMTRHG